METNSTPDELPPAAPDEQLGEQIDETASAPMEAPADETPDPAADSGASVAGDGDSLAGLANRALSGRLAPAEEERAATLLKEALLEGKEGVPRAGDALPKLPWIVGVRGVEAAWPEMKTRTKAQLLKALTETDSDAARRVRLSLARALFKQDVPAAIKVAIAVCKEMRDKETGALSVKNAQIFANVFIGKAKPWIGQVSLAEMKPAEADLLVHCALMAVFSLPHPPVTQLGVLRWAAEGGRLAKLNESAVGAVTRGIARWSGKWQGALRKEVAGLPEEIASAFKPVAPESGAEAVDSQAAEAEESSAEEGDEDEEGEPAPKKERPVYEPRPQRPPSAPEPREEGPRKERPVYQPRSAGGASAFSLSEALRGIDTYVQSLRAELAQAKARQKDDDSRKGRRTPDRGVIIAGEPTAEELGRLNQQLEARIVELQQRIDDLMADAEDRAASMGAHADSPVGDDETRLRSLLALKLQEDFADFLALEKESQSVVVQQHYKGLLRHVFDVLRQEGVELKEGA